MNKLVLVMLVFISSGCTMMPFYHRPGLPTSNQWPQASSKDAVVSSTQAADLGWREFFQDTRLQELIKSALSNNRDLRVAVLNVEVLRAQYRIGLSRILPTVQLEANGTKQRGPTTKAGDFENNSIYNAGLGLASYELDFFGRVRSLKRQALEKYFASAQARRTAHISLVSELAIQYLRVLHLDEQLALTQETLKSQDEYYQLIKKSYELGNASQLDLKSVEVQVQTAKVNAADYARQRAQAHNALVLLVGEPLKDDLSAAKPFSQQSFMEDLPAGLPSDLLQRRPDILDAEHQLKGANANVGAARAAFFPKITLTASGGLSSLALSDLFVPAGPAWKFAPEITMPIFDGDATRISLELAEIQKRIEIAQYEKVIQNAFREVADALAARATLNDQLKSQQDLVAAQETRYNLADMRYKNGIDSYLSVLLAQQDLYNAKQKLIQTQFNRYSNLIVLYVSLGGGWNENTKS